MKIAIMAESICGKMTGQGRVTLNLIKQLSEITNDLDLIIIGPEKIKEFGIHCKTYTYNNENILQKIKSYFIIIKKINKENIDILHCPTNYGAPYFWFFKKKKVRTIYDACGAEMSKKLHNSKQIRLRIEFKSYGRAIKRIATCSESSKNEIVNHYGFEPNTIDVIYLGADERFIPLNKKECQNMIKKNFNITKPFLFHLSACDSRKNIEGIIKAFIKSKKKFTTEHKLLIGGSINNISESLKNLDDDILFLDYISDNDLPMFYNASTAFIFPSFHEGFGLPILEAMKCGTPVITSDKYATKEIANGAAILVDPYDIDKIAESMISLVNNEKIWYEKHKNSLERASMFTWEKCAKDYIDFYKKIS